MNIFISANDKYIYPTKVMLTSFLANNPLEPHHIYFMHSSVQPENIKSLDQIVTAHGSQFTAVQITADDFGIFPCSERFTIEVYYRFLIPIILPETETRAMWMDVDLVVNGPIDEFYYQDLGGCCFAACQDIGTKGVYVNSGVICFDIAKMRQYRLEDYRDYYLTHNEEVFWPDQDILNGMFAGHIKVWDAAKWNVQIMGHRQISASDLKVVNQNAEIVHFVGFYKPWAKDYAHPAGHFWDRYHALAFHYSPAKTGIYLMVRRLHRLGLRTARKLRIDDLKHALYQCTFLRKLVKTLKNLRSR